jgi:hypothetical protein
LSFPGEKRDYVEKVAAALAELFGEEAVLYDRFHTAEFARFNLGFLLPDHYHEHSDLIVVVLCTDYEKKEWCGLEWRAISTSSNKAGDADVMLFRADDAPVRGLYSLDGYAPVDAFTPEAAARLPLARCYQWVGSSNPVNNASASSRERAVAAASTTSRVRWGAKPSIKSYI